MDLDKLFTPVSVDQPSGENLEYQPVFAELERVAQGRPEQQVGGSIIPAEEPDWGAVRTQSLALLERSKDLRPAIHLCRALLTLEGYEGFAVGLAATRGLLEMFWESVHPQLDADDDNDPTMRLNALGSLVDTAMLNAVRRAPLVRSRALGKFSLRDWALATGEAKPEEGQPEPVPIATIEGAFADADPAALAAIGAAVAASLTHLQGIEAVVSEKLGDGRGPDFTRLLALVRQANTVLKPRVAARTPGVDAAETEAAAAPGDQPSAGVGSPVPAPRAGGGSVVGAGTIGSRDDVERVIDLLCGYYDRHEPSSPVPLLLRRAKRLVKMSFMDIIRDMAPGGVEQIELIRGREDETSS